MKERQGNLEDSTISNQRAKRTNWDAEREEVLKIVIAEHFLKLLRDKNPHI